MCLAIGVLKDIVEPCDCLAIEKIIGMLTDPDCWQDDKEVVSNAIKGARISGIQVDEWIFASDSDVEESQFANNPIKFRQTRSRSIRPWRNLE